MKQVDCEYRIRDDIKFILEAEQLNSLDLSKKSKISRTTLDEIEKTGRTREDVCEKFYSFAYKNRYRINAVKEELIKEKYPLVLFHGSKNGLSCIDVIDARQNCDFGKGFYLGESYYQALAFVNEKEKSSVYSFSCSLDDLTVKKFECSLDWMLAICYYRGTLGEYADRALVQRVISEIEDADVIVAPIADNKMFYIMEQFTEGEINADVALHSLSASKLGLQYVLKSEKALERLAPIEKYYVSIPEREDCKKQLIERSFEIDTKLRLAKREYKTGLYIEELFNEKI